jgi:glycosyltransferase involved in cell wall biosynthesis
MEEALISIIIPIYNVEKYIRECIDSVINQTYSNIEIILVDDKSPDSSPAICDEYLKRDNRIHVIHKDENEGLGFARNTGLNVAQGDYVGFVDSDDYLKEDAIELLYKSIIEYKVDHAKGGFLRVNDNHEFIRFISYQTECFRGNRVLCDFLPRLLGSSPGYHDSIEMSVCASLYSRSIIEKNHIRFESERVMISEDLCFNMEYCKYSCGVCVLNNLIYNYRVNTSSLTSIYLPNRFSKNCNFFQEIESRLKGFGYKQDAYNRLCTNFFISVRSCISMEIRHTSEHPQKRIENVYQIVNDNLTQQLIAHYPLKSLNVRQFFFICLVKWRMVHLLFLLGKMRFF